MGQYCPKCFSNKLSIVGSSVVHVIINGKQMDSGRILYNPNKDIDIFKEELVNKIREFFNWYQSLQNKTPIQNIQIFSSDYKCNNQCSLQGVKISVINDLVSPAELMSIVKTNAKNHDVTIEINANEMY